MCISGFQRVVSGSFAYLKRWIQMNNRHFLENEVVSCVQIVLQSKPKALFGCLYSVTVRSHISPVSQISFLVFCLFHFSYQTLTRILLITYHTKTCVKIQILFLPRQILNILHYCLILTVLSCRFNE